MRKLMWFTFGLCGACAFCVGFALTQMIVPGLLCAIIGVLMLLMMKKVRAFRIPAAVFVGAAAGFLLYHCFDRVVLTPVYDLDQTTQRVTVIARDYSFQTDYGYGFDGTLMLDGRHYRITVYTDDDPALKPGNRVIGQFRFEKTIGSGVDEILYHHGQGIYLKAYQQGNLVVERCWSTPLRDLPTLWRAQWYDAIDSLLPQDEAAFAKGLLLGDRSDLDYETQTAFKLSGISHIVAVSGLHVSILFGMLYVLCGRRRFLTAVVSIPLIVLFAAVAGFTPSVCRASVMQILVIAAMCFQRRYDGPTALSFAALVMVCANPMVLFSASFQLSFACMAGISCCADPLGRWLRDRSRLGKWDYGPVRGLISSVSVSVSSGLLTVPLVGAYFGTVSLVAPLTNMLTLWVISLVFLLLMFMCLLWVLVPGIAGVLAAIVVWPIRYILQVSRLLADVPLSAVYTESAYIVIWLLLIYVLFAALVWTKMKPTALIASLCALSLCLALTLSRLESRLDGCRMTVFDVGQGQAILLQSDGCNYLVDCGGDDDQTVADTVSQALLSQGITRLDGIIVTHYDRDHTGAITHLLTRVDADQILLPYCSDEYDFRQRLMEQTDASITVVKEDSRICFGSSVLTLYAPESYNSANESCMCILFQSGECDILITGDRGNAGERLLLSRHSLPDVDVLIAGHHGSAGATSHLLLQTVQPEYVFISCGNSNRYQHPADELILRLLEYGCAIFCTNDYGTLIYRG